ncbi:MAG: hypothetical protein K6E49_06440 [Lachnospiraceae bacterium]|nr:hypothetical protein [Lachnospiraceae bacterium]
MELYSVAFIGFVIISAVIHEAVGRKCPKSQWIVRLAASVVFYAGISGWKMIFLAISILTVWCAGISFDSAVRKYDKEEALRRKRMSAFILVIINLSILALTKYLLPAVSHPILLPLGISYYTLMAVSYIIDIYGEKYESEHNPLRLALYLMWFPQMLQGPVNRFGNISPTLYGTYRVSVPDVKKALMLFAFGAFKKYAIANVMIGTVAEIFGGDITEKPGGFLFTGAVLFALCQYADFSGGIDMMMAASELFGVKMDVNFRQPYFAGSIAQFWRRWHITLGSFMKDYVFFPFALTHPVMKLNNKLVKKYGRHCARSVVGGLGNLLVFFLVGLWHGSQLHFLLWGLYNGMIIAVSDMCDPLFARMRSAFRIDAKSRSWNVFRIVRTFILICLAGYFDYIERVRDCFTAFKNTFLHFSPSLSRLWLLDLFNSRILSVQKITVFILAVAVLFTTDVISERKKDPAAVFSGLPAAARWPLAYAFLILLLMSFTLVGDNAGFMYAAF